MEKKRATFTLKTKLWTWGGVSLFALVLFALLFFPSGVYTWFRASDASFIPGMVLLGLSGLLFIGRSGTFDVVNYGFFRLGESFRKEKTKAFADAYEYSNHRRELRDKTPIYFVPFLFLGALFIGLGLVFMMLGLNAIV
jgi:hypothetical protein